jgi:carboxypeptidase PM20D1
VKKLVSTLLVLLVVFVGALVARALNFPSRQVPADPAPALELDEPAVLARFARSLTFETVTAQSGTLDAAPFHALHAYLRRSFPRVHETLELETVGELSLLYTWPGSEPALDALLLMGHTDVVPVAPGTEGDWEHPPFSGEIADGLVWGRGAMDDKLAVLATLEAVEALLRDGFRPRRTVYLAFGHDEEGGGHDGARRIAARLAERGVERLALVLDEGGVITEGQVPGVAGPVAVVGVAEKGSVTLTLRVDGPGGHSSTPPEQTNIGILARAIARLEADPFPMHMDGAVRSMLEFVGPELPFGQRLALANLWLFEPLVLDMLAAAPNTRAMLHTTTAATMIDGGVKTNVLAASATAIVNLRIVPGETPASVAERVRLVIDDERVGVEGAENGRSPSPVSDTTGPAFETLSRTIREVAGDEVLVAPYLVMAGTDARHFTRLSSAVYRFLPMRFELGDMQRIHGTNERVAASSYLDSVRFLYRLVRNVDEMP